MRRSLLMTVLGIAAACVVLRMVGDPVGALVRTGPYSGRVLDAVSGTPVPDAYILFGWSGSPMLGEHVSCAGSVVARSDASGAFHVSWQGFRTWWIGQAKLHAPGFTVIAVGYTPWNLGRESAGTGPQSAGGSEPIRLTPTSSPWTDAQGFHMGRCEGVRDGEAISGYVRFLQARRALCDAGGDVESDQLAGLLGFLPEPLDVMPAGASDAPVPRSAGSLRQPLYDALGIAPSTAGSGNYIVSTHDPRAVRACALLDVRAPALEALGK